MKRGEGDRKTRSDKKIDVKPTVSEKTKLQLYKFSELCEMPVKVVLERLCERACTAPLILDDLHDWFRRDYYCGPSIHKGYLDRPRLKIIYREETGKIYTRLPQATYDKLCELAYALDLPPTTTAGVLIKRTLINREFMYEFVRSMKHLSNEQKNVVHMYLRQIWGFRSL